MPSEPFVGEKDAEQLWQKISERYRGKVVALDFWGRGACRVVRRCLR